METGRSVVPVKWWLLVTTSESKPVLKDVLSEQRTKAKKTTSVCCPISFHLQWATCPCKLLPTTSNSKQRLSTDVLFVSLSQMFVQDIKEPLGFHGIAIDGVFNLHLNNPWRMLQDLLLGWWAFIPYHSTETDCVLTVLITWYYHYCKRCNWWPAASKSPCSLAVYIAFCFISYEAKINLSLSLSWFWSSTFTSSI